MCSGCNICRVCGRKGQGCHGRCSGERVDPTEAQIRQERAVATAMAMAGDDYAGKPFRADSAPATGEEDGTSSDEAETTTESGSTESGSTASSSSEELDN